MAKEKPNILHLFTDQQRFDTIAALGNPVIKTPNLDRLVREGTAFVNAFSPSPVCISARCSMIHGQYPANTGCYENRIMPTDGRQSMMDGLNDAGYLTHGIGKCHFTPDGHALRGFRKREEMEEIINDPDRDDYLKHLHANGYKYVCDPHGLRGEMYYIPQPSQLPDRLHPTQWIGDRSVRFIEERAKNKQPWYLFSSYVHPHPPFAPPNPWHKLYRAPLMPLPLVPQDADALNTWVNRKQNRYKYRDQGIDNNLMRNMKAHYYACISFIDFQVGRILDTLEKTGQLDNTLIVYTSDHGEHLGDRNCFGKRSMHDSAARIPMLCRLPGRFGAGEKCTAPVSLVDVAPTVLAAAGGTLKSHTPDGEDMADIAAGANDRKTVYSQLAFCAGKTAEDRAPFMTSMAVTEKWKYFYSAPDNMEYLFDKTGDPQETRNRAGIPFTQGALKFMRNNLMKFLNAHNDTAGIENGAWKKFDVPDVSVNPDDGFIQQDNPWADLTIPGYTDQGAFGEDDNEYYG